MTTPRTEEELNAQAAELDCASVVVPVVERLDVIIALLTRLPVQFGRSPNGLARNLLRDLFPEYDLPD